MLVKLKQSELKSTPTSGHNAVVEKVVEEVIKVIAKAVIAKELQNFTVERTTLY